HEYSSILHPPLPTRRSSDLNGQRAGLHFAEEYPLGAIAQLEERLRGTQEVAGSSPASSTPPADVAATIVGAHEFRNRFGWYMERDRKSTRLNSSHEWISYAV